MDRKQAAVKKKSAKSASVDQVKGASSDKDSRKSARNNVDAGAGRKNGGWREIEARREKAALKASLADVWDENFDLDAEILADLEHRAEYFVPQTDVKEEIFTGNDDDDGDDDDDYFEEEEL